MKLLQPLVQDKQRHYIPTGDAKDNESTEALRVYMTKLTPISDEKKTQINTALIRDNSIVMVMSDYDITTPNIYVTSMYAACDIKNLSK